MIDYAELIRGCIEIILVLFLYGLAKSNGRKEAENAQLVRWIRDRDWSESKVDARMSRMEDSLEKFKQRQDGTNYRTATDAELLSLHEGRTEGLSPISEQEHTKPDSDSTD